MAALGNEPVVQRHEHAQAPPALTVPVPATMEPLLATEVPCAAAAVVATDAGGVTTVEEAGAAAGPPTMGAMAPVPFCAMARLWNIACVLAATGLIEKTIPVPQWAFCAQYIPGVLSGSDNDY